MSPSGNGDVGEASRFASSVRTEQSETLRLHIEPFRSPSGMSSTRSQGAWPRAPNLVYTLPSLRTGRDFS
jgi:hypothetical protein